MSNRCMDRQFPPVARGRGLVRVHGFLPVVLLASIPVLLLRVLRAFSPLCGVLRVLSPDAS